MQLQPKQKMVLNMTTYGITLGGLAGALSAVTLIMTSNTFSFLGNTLPIMLVEVFSIAVFGMLFGGFFGLVSGIYSGISMAVITHVFFDEIPSPQHYKIAMGMITAIAVSLYFFTGVWNLRLDGMDTSSWTATLLMAVVIAVYASQRVVSYYLYEWSIRKQKAYT